MPAAGSRRSLQRAISRAQRVLLQSQRPDGSWNSPAEVGSWVTAQVTVALRHLGRLTDEEAKAASRFLRAEQRTDGSFLVHAYAKQGDLGATACGLAALHALDPAGNREAVARARAFIDASGGDPAVIALMELGDFAAVFLAMAGLLPAASVPAPELGVMLGGPLRQLLERRFHSGVFMGALELELILRGLRGERPGLRIAILKRHLLALLAEFQNDNGSINVSAFQTVLALPALRAAGMSLAEPPLANALRWLEAQKVSDQRGLHFDGFGAEVWSTAFDARALLQSGLPARDPQLSRAVEWLCDAQLQKPMPKVDNRKPGAILKGGWAFQRTNHTMPDCDDAGVVLTTLGLALQPRGARALDGALERRARQAADRGGAWVLDMQNPDGGFSAFVWGLPGKKPGAVMKQPPRVPLGDPLALTRLLLSPEPVMGDPSTEDVTGRVLHGLGQLGFTTAVPAVQRAVEFLRLQQCQSGAFWGRWMVNFLAGTSFALMGLAAVRADLGAPWIRRAVRFLRGKQNADGGFGETPDSYQDEALAGVGPSMAPLTGLVLQALVDVGEGGSDEAKRAARYLLRTQSPDGTWPNGEYLHTNVPPDTFYVYPEAARFFPLEGLAKYEEHLRHHDHPAPPGRFGDALLDSMRGLGDPVADQVVAELFANGEVASVNDLLMKLFRSDEPVPAGLPQRVRDYFEATNQLPAFADGRQLALAQALFARSGWQVAMALFCSSLPQAYAAGKGAKVLTQTQEMTRHTKQRIFETAQFLFDVTDEGGLAPNGRGIRTTQKVRLMHAAIRHLLREKGWNASQDGVPVNQEDLAGTLMTFSVVTLEGLGKLGIDATAEEGEAWLHLWKVVGHLLGVSAELLPLDVADGGLLMDAIRERQWQTSEAGRALAAPLVELMQGYFPGTALDGLPVSMIRYLAGDHCADLLGLPRADLSAQLIHAADGLEHLLDEDGEDVVPALFGAFANMLMKGIVTAERGGKQAAFRIPAALQPKAAGPA